MQLAANKQIRQQSSQTASVEGGSATQHVQSSLTEMAYCSAGGRMWITDYGNPEVEDDFQHLLAYSPVHNVRLPDRDLAQYPAIMLSFAVRSQLECNNGKDN